MHDILDFGLYKGFEVGIVFVSDHGYFKWCIENIPGFHLYDLQYLIKLGQLRKDEGWQFGMVGPEMNEVIQVFGSIDEILPEGGTYKIDWPDDLIAMNDRNCFEM